MSILIVGPISGPVTGQNVANNLLIEGLKSNNCVDYVDTNQISEISNFNNQGKLSIKKIFSDIKNIFEIIKKINKNNYTKIYITPGQTFLGFIKFAPIINYANIKKEQIFLHFHGGYFRKMYQSCSSVKQKYLKKVLKKANGVIVLSNSLKKMFLNIIETEKIYICENGIDETFLSEKPKKKNLCVNILFLSNLMKTKGILDLIESTTYMEYKFKLHIAGNLPDDIKETFFDKINKNSNIHYYGPVYGEKKKKLFEKTDVFCLPTYYPVEGQPISILEAMGMGCAIVTTRHSGIPDIVQNGINCFFCEKQNPNSIAKEIKNAFDNLMILSQNNKQIVKEKYLQKHFVERIECILK